MGFRIGVDVPDEISARIKHFLCKYTHPQVTSGTHTSERISTGPPVARSQSRMCPVMESGGRQIP